MAKGDAGKYIGVGLLGAALGAIAGVLFTPYSGRETRQKISRGAKKAERRAVWGFKKARTKAARGWKSARRRVKLG